MKYEPKTNNRYREATFHDAISARDAIYRINADLAHAEAIIREREAEIERAVVLLGAMLCAADCACKTCLASQAFLANYNGGN